MNRWTQSPVLVVAAVVTIVIQPAVHQMMMMELMIMINLPQRNTLIVATPIPQYKLQPYSNSLQYYYNN